MSERISQNKQVLAHLRLYGSITQREAVHKYNIYRLGARIHDLRSAGHSIPTTMVNDGRSHYARYTLISECRS